MSCRQSRRKSIVFMLIFSFLGMQTVPAYAGLISTETLVAQDSQRIDKAQLGTLLNQQEIRNQLATMGVDPGAVEQRIANLTDEEISMLNERLNDLPAGGDILGILLLLFVIFVITDALGATDIFPFVHPIK